MGLGHFTATETGVFQTSQVRNESMVSNCGTLNAYLWQLLLVPQLRIEALKLLAQCSPQNSLHLQTQKKNFDPMVG